MGTSGTCILDIPFDDITKTPFSLGDAKTCRYRLLDCRSFAERKSLRIFEYQNFPTQKYGAISYVWKGLKAEEGAPLFTIDRTDGSGTMSVEVLRIACVAMLQKGKDSDSDNSCDFLWVDGLCIIQGRDENSKIEKDEKDKKALEDKKWQMERMYQIYKTCTKCVVLPGGIQRLAELAENTPWAHRAWTLQEAIAPSSAECLFSWKDGDCVLRSYFETVITEVEKGVAATADMKAMLERSMNPRCHVSVLDDSKEWRDLRDGGEVKLLGERSQVQALIGALDLKGEEGMENAIWRSSFMRTAKYEVDNVFSIMGLMGVTLNTSEYGHDDRIQATIALMREILLKGRPAEWLGISTKMRSNPALSTIPVFPTYLNGKAVVTTPEGVKEASSVMDGWWMIADTPEGYLDDEAYLEFDVVAASIEKGQSGAGFESVDGSKWKVLSTHQGPTYAVWIGTKTAYSNGSQPMMIDPNNMVLMLIQETSTGKFGSIGYAFVSKETIEGDAWSRETFKVGGRPLTTER
ncbi:hypothetical protein G7Z17_g1783 [Cylindrodendrum hubeiense]|uniref:Heterokaryon incompatibility domain-containing protein n=1 Tax=Cylindrodendrum hubeiense TaxID=595255 RepID=A0A9P5HFG2_9HYPO|nr:hypothetical protein G7Z17_g1783 [Cylindrodendrum hubeiense]